MEIIFLLVFVVAILFILWVKREFSNIKKERNLFIEDNKILSIALKKKQEDIDCLSTQLNAVFNDKARICEEYNTMVKRYNTERDVLKCQYEGAIDKLQATYDRELSARKSSEVRVGQISEQILPFLSAWPFDPKNFRFSGDPVDGISYEADRVVFVEIKTGKSRLSKRQENIKKLVKEGKVEFITIRINEEGILVK